MLQSTGHLSSQTVTVRDRLPQQAVYVLFAVDYAWDDYNKPQSITLMVFANRSMTYDLTKLGEQQPLTYDNYFYIQASATFDPHYLKQADHRTRDKELCLEALANGKVILNCKKNNEPNQLWRHHDDGLIESVGLTQHAPSIGTTQRERHAAARVLDVLESRAGTDGRKQLLLMVRQVEPTRLPTQTWKFTHERRLVCVGHETRCAQADGGRLSAGQAIELAAYIPQPSTSTVHHTPSTPAAAYAQLFDRRREKPGSGLLRVS